jgi:hypothetical protein
MSDPSFLSIDDFSLEKGGPFFRLLVRTRLMGEDFAPVARRAVFLSLLAWLPLLVLSTIEGAAFGQAVKIPFFHDFPVSVRLLLAIPILIAAEGEALIGSADIQSLADLGNSYQIIREMRPAPIDLWTTIVPMAAFTVVPFLPLALAVLPFEEIVKGIIGILF